MSGAKVVYDKAAAALCRCRLDLAKSLFREAGRLYALSAQERKHVDLNKLNAAICFFLAGGYDDAIGIIDTIQTAKLEKDLSELCEEVYEEARKRRRGSYWETVIGDLKEMRAKGLHKDILALLKNNPYCLKATEFARQMRDSCDALGMKEVAALFNCDLKEVIGYD